MTGIALAEAGLCVVDNLLPPDAFAALGQEVMRSRFQSVHHDGWDRAWAVGDGNPLRGQSVHYDPIAPRRASGPRFPTGTAIDLAIVALRQAALLPSAPMGPEGRDWDAIYLAPWIYPAGSALQAHRDNGPYAGSFTFFLHDQWAPQWGGELLVYGSPACAADGFARAVVPRPNRLALLGADTIHRVARVDPSAGDRHRLSLAGFFLRPQA